MNCHSIRNRILAIEEPADLPDELAAHIDDCAACRSWQRRFLLVDRALLAIPVPETDGTVKMAAMERIRSMPVVKKVAAVEKKVRDKPIATNGQPVKSTSAKPQAAKPMPLNLANDLPARKRLSFGQYAAKFWPAGLVAATLLVGTVAWISLRGNRTPPAVPTPSDPMLDNLVKLNVEMAKTNTAAERVALLSKMAEELNQEMRDIARADATGENMQALEEMYKKVVLNGLVNQAKLVERTQRDNVLIKVAESLAQAGQKAEQMAAESPQLSAERLRDAAGTAREGTKRIRNLIKEA